MTRSLALSLLLLSCSACSDAEPALIASGVVDVSADATLDVDAGSDPRAPDVGGPEGEARPEVPEPVCLEADPAKLAFGGKLAGEIATLDLTLHNCGSASATLTMIALEAAPDTAFGVSLPPAFPVVLGPDESLSLPVSYVPEALNPIDDQGKPIEDEAILRIHASGTPPVILEVEVSGFGVVNYGAFPAITVAEGEEVPTGTLLHLSGSESYSCCDEEGQPEPVASYAWSVTQPAGSAGAFMPDASAEDVTFLADVAGTYTFRLTTLSQSGMQSFWPAEAVVIAGGGILDVELSWETPGAPDLDAADLDLHYAHELAIEPGGLDADGDGEPEPWFHPVYDTYRDNPNPNWGALDPAVEDDPSLGADDTGTSRFESVSLHLAPEDGIHHIGVHCWNDKGYGPSVATVRVFVQGALGYEASAELEAGEMWEVAILDWGSNAPLAPVEGVGGEPHVYGWPQ